MKLICKICGKEFENRSSHLRLCHNMSNNEYFGETCRSAKAEDLLLKDLATVPTQGYQCNQYQSAY